MKRITYMIRALVGLGIVGLVVPFLGLPSQWRLYLGAIVCAGVILIAVRLRARVQALHGDVVSGARKRADSAETVSEEHQHVVNDI